MATLSTKYMMKEMNMVITIANMVAAMFFQQKPPEISEKFKIIHLGPIVKSWFSCNHKLKCNPLFVFPTTVLLFILKFQKSKLLWTRTIFPNKL